MITIGVDFSKRSAVYCVLDDNGKKLKRIKIDNEPALIDEFFGSLPDEPVRLAMEATRNWGLYYEAIKEHVDEFQLAHPVKMKAITHSEIKTDDRDSDSIAMLAYTGFLPKAYVSHLGTRQLRSLLRFRMFLVREKVAIRNQVQTLIDRNLWPCQRPTSFKSPFSLRGRNWLKSIELPPRERFILDKCLDNFDLLAKQTREIESYVEEQSLNLEGIENLRTVPGFHKSKVHIYSVLFEIDNIQRFHKARNLAHYAGLIPRQYSSGQFHRTGKLVKQSNAHLRTAIIESVFGAMLKDKNLRDYYLSVKNRAGSGAAVIATARKLTYAIYHVLKDKTVYKSVPSATASSPSAIER